MKLAIFLPNWIGDVVMATPALRAVRNQFPLAEIVGIMRPYVADVLAGSGLIDRSLFYNPRGTVKSQRGWTFARALRQERFDTALLLTNSLRTGSLAWWSGASRRIGFARDLRGWLLTDRLVPRSRSTPHPVMDEYLRLVDCLVGGGSWTSEANEGPGFRQSPPTPATHGPSLGKAPECSTSSRKMELAVLPDDQKRLNEFWESVGTSSQAPPRLGAIERPYVCLNTGGAFGAAKNWPKEHFAELAGRIAGELQTSVLIVCGPAERDDARWIAATANHPDVYSLADVPLSIGLTKAAIHDCELLVTTDSGPRHFASAFGTPVITLFGPTHIAWSETYDTNAEHLQLKLDCGPCQKRECPLQHHRCMKELSVDQVFAAVQRKIGSKHPQQKVGLQMEGGRGSCRVA